jgi:hypothetical protein
MKSPLLWLAAVVILVPTALCVSTVSIDISLGSGTRITGGPSNTNVSWKDTDFLKYYLNSIRYQLVRRMKNIPIIPSISRILVRTIIIVPRGGVGQYNGNDCCSPVERMP